MPDLKHYKNITRKKITAFRKRDRDQKREQQRRVTRWAAMSHQYHEVVGESALMAPEPTWECRVVDPPSEHGGTRGGFTQPLSHFSCKFYY